MGNIFNQKRKQTLPLPTSFLNYKSVLGLSLQRMSLNRKSELIF